MIKDAKAQFDCDGPTRIVVVAPRILLAEQLCKEFLEIIDDVAVFHVHSGDTDWSALSFSAIFLSSSSPRRAVTETLFNTLDTVL